MFKTLVKTLTFVMALSFSIGAHAWDEETDGRFQGQALMGAITLQQEAAELIKNIGSIEDQVGMSMPESHGLIKALGEKESEATEVKQRIDTIVQIMKMSSNTDEILTGFETVNKLTAQIRDLDKATKDLVK